MPVMAGDQISFFGTLFKVVGTMEPTGIKFFDQSIFMTMDAAYKMAEDSKTKSMQPISLSKDEISTVLVRVEEGIAPDRVAIRIEHDVDGVRAMASDEVISTVRKQLMGLLKGILIISALLWILSLLMMGFVFYMIVNERQRELGLLRSMGAKKKHVFGLIITEAVIISGPWRNCRIDKRFGHFDDLQGCDTATPEIAVFIAANDIPVRTCSWCRHLFFADGDSFILVSSSVGKQYGTI